MVDVDLPAVASTTPVVDEHDWTYPSMGVRARARLRTWHTTSGGYLALVTDLWRGTSIINASESVHAALVERFGPQVTVIGHSPRIVAGGTDWFQLITIKPDGGADWAPFGKAQLVDLLGPQITEGFPGEELDNQVGEQPAAVYSTRMTSAALRLEGIVRDEDVDTVLHAVHTTQHQLTALLELFEDALSDDLVDAFEEAARLIDLECLEHDRGKPRPGQSA